MNAVRATARRAVWLWFAGWLCMATAEPPRETSRSIDAARSHAEFTLRAMVVVGVRGQFGDVSGALHIDHFRSQGWVDATIDADGVRMDDRDREDWARSAEFFDSATHPLIRFVSDPIPLQRLRSGGDLPGTLVLRGVSRPLQLTVLPGECAQPGIECPIRALGSIVRSEFGMRSKRAVLGDRVQLDLSVFLDPDRGSQP